MKLRIGDWDARHLSWKPLGIFAGGAACFGLGGFQFAIAGAGLGQAWAVVVGLASMAIAFRALVRERQEFDAALAGDERAAERSIADRARDEGAV